MRRVRGASLVAVAMVATASPGVVHAQKAAKQRAFDKMQEGQRRFDLGKFDEAIKLFEESYDIYPFPEALYNLGQTWREKKEFAKALFYYEAFLRNKPGAANTADVEALIAECKEQIRRDEELKKKKPIGVDGKVDGGEVSTQEPVPAKDPPAKAPPVEIVPPPPAVAVSPAPPWYQDTWGWVLVGSGAAIMGAGGGFYVAASGKESDAEGKDELTRRDLLADADDFRTYGAVSLAVGGAVIVGGVVKLWLTDGERQEPTAVGFIGGANWIGVAGRF